MEQWQEDDRRWSSLLAQAQSGDQQAYTTLLAELKEVIRAYLLGRLGFSDGIDDFVQESLLAIHLARHTYDPNRPFRPWLFAIVRHKTIDCLRKGRKQNEQVISAITYEPNFSEQIDSERIMGVLSPQLIEPLLLTKIMGFSQSEVADRLGISVALVKVRVFRAIKQLQAQWVE